MVRQVLNGSALDHWPAANHGAGWPNFNRVHYFSAATALVDCAAPLGLAVPAASRIDSVAGRTSTLDLTDPARERAGVRGAIFFLTAADSERIFRLVFATVRLGATTARVPDRIEVRDARSGPRRDDRF